VQERVYPVDDTRHQIDHVKLLIADGKATVGGMNWGKHSHRNHDFVLETRIPSEVDRLVRIFEQDWSLAGGRPAPLAAVKDDIAQTAPGEEIRAMLRGALMAARHRVWAEVYTLTDPEVVAELVVAHRRGVDVRVILDPHQVYNRHAYSVLREGDVDVRWYPVPRGVLLHAKVGLFDSLLVLGSANWTLSGLGVNHELDIETSDLGAVGAYRSRFEADWQRSATSELCGGGPADPGGGGPLGPAVGGSEPEPGAGMLPKLTCGTVRSPSSAEKYPNGLKPSAPAISEVGRVCSLML
jgi:phosphatidylserine/phosphatidylglycerophosphate/cardiolipin synthase-like enzyme